MNIEYNRKVKQRDKLYKRWKIVQNEYTERAFKNMKNEVNKLRLKLKREYAQKNCQKQVLIQRKCGKS